MSMPLVNHDLGVDFGRFEGLFCPPAPGEALLRWLWFKTPPGAPLIPISREARSDPTRYRGHPGFVPKIAGRLSPFPDKRQAEICAEVEAEAPGVFREPGTHAPRKGMNAWGLEAAYYRDLWGVPFVEIAKRQEYTVEMRPERSKGAERRVRDGRELLHDLGAWPWALWERGTLPARWWEQRQVAQALAGWFRDATLQSLNDALRAVELAASDEGRELVDYDPDHPDGPMAISTMSWDGACLAWQAAVQAVARDRAAAA